MSGTSRASSRRSPMSSGLRLPGAACARRVGRLLADRRRLTSAWPPHGRAGAWAYLDSGIAQGLRSVPRRGRRPACSAGPQPQLLAPRPRQPHGCPPPAAASPRRSLPAPLPRRLVAGPAYAPPRSRVAGPPGRRHRGDLPDRGHDAHRRRLCPGPAATSACITRVLGHAPRRAAVAMPARSRPLLGASPVPIEALLYRGESALARARALSDVLAAVSAPAPDALAEL